MSSMRFLTRHNTLQLLYSLEINPSVYREAEAHFLASNAKRRKRWNEFAGRLGQLTWERRKELDAQVKGVLKNWTIDRIALTDRICIRMALCELKFFEEIPLRVTIDEYINLARRFGGEESPQFVNGVLDALAADYRHKDFQVPKKQKDDRKEKSAPEAPSSPGADDGSIPIGPVTDKTESS